MAERSSKKNKVALTSGFTHWLILLVMFLIALLLLENYQRFGVIKGPIELTIFIIGLVVQNYWLFGCTILYYVLQLSQTFLIEKLLASHALSEVSGMSLHGLNTFFWPILSLVTAHKGNASSYIIKVITSSTILLMTKVWSYAYVNSTYRRQKFQKSGQSKDHSFKQYPQNVTVQNLIEYFILTPYVQYELSIRDRSKPDWKKFAKLCLRAILIAYGVIFISEQFLLQEIPEMFRNNKKHASMLNTVICILRVAMPAHFLWYIYTYIGIFHVCLPGHAALVGSKQITFCSDWWNAEDLYDFWRKWNFPVYNCLKLTVAKPLIQNGYGTKTVNLIVFSLAGFIHEYTYSWVYKLYTGGAFFITLLEIPFMQFSSYICKKYGSKLGNFTVLLYLISIHTCSIFILYNHICQKYNEH